MVSRDDRELQQWIKSKLHSPRGLAEPDIARIADKALQLIRGPAGSFPKLRKSNLLFARAALVLFLCGIATLAALLHAPTGEAIRESAALNDQESVIAVNSQARFTTDPGRRQVNLDQGQVYLDLDQPTKISTRYGSVHARKARLYVLCSLPSPRSALTVMVVSGQVKVSNSHGIEQGGAGDVIFARAEARPKKDTTSLNKPSPEAVPEKELQVARDKLDQAIKARAKAFSDYRTIAQVREKMRSARSINDKKKLLREYRQAIRHKHDLIRQAVREHHDALKAYSRAWRNSRSRKQRSSDRKAEEAAQAIRAAQQAWRNAVNARNAYRRKVGRSGDGAAQRKLQELEKNIEQARLGIRQAQEQWHQAVQERGKRTRKPKTRK